MTSAWRERERKREREKLSPPHFSDLGTGGVATTAEPALADRASPSPEDLLASKWTRYSRRFRTGTSGRYSRPKTASPPNDRFGGTREVAGDPRPISISLLLRNLLRCFRQGAIRCAYLARSIRAATLHARKSAVRDESRSASSLSDPCPIPRRIDRRERLLSKFLSEGRGDSIRERVARFPRQRSSRDRNIHYTER